MLDAAIIGLGRMGCRHLQVMDEIGVKIVGICDKNPESLKKCQNEIKSKEYDLYSDADELLKNTRPECVIIATTSPTHCDYTCLAAEHGAQYILCEKPMATSLSQCQKMIDVCKQNDALLSINHQMRFMEQYTKPKEIINSEAFGGLSSVTVVGGNFGLAMNGTHYFEMFRYMTDEYPYEVTAWFSEEKVPNPRGPQFEDRAGSVRITTPSGKRFFMDVGADQGHGIKVLYSGKFGQILIDELQGEMFISLRQEDERNLSTTRYACNSISSMEKILPADATAPTKFVMNALINKRNYPTGEDGMMAIKTLIAAYCSDEQNHNPIKIKNDYLPVNRIFPWA